MRPEEIRPYIRYARKLTRAAAARFPRPTIAYDNRLFTCASGIFRVTVENEPRTLCPGQTLFVPAGVPYFYPESEGDFLLYAFNFDFTSAHRERAMPVPPDFADVFDVQAIIEGVPASAAPEFSVPALFSCPDAAPLAEETEREYRHARNYFDARASALFSALLLSLARNAGQTEDASADSLARQVAAFVREHCAEKCDNESVAAAFSYHPNYLNRLLVAYTGMSLHKYVTRCRMDRAILLLQSTSEPVAAIGRAVGYPDLSHFSKVFRRVTGTAPGNFRCKL